MIRPGAMILLGVFGPLLDTVEGLEESRPGDAMLSGLEPYITEAGRGDPLRTRDWGRVLIGVTGWPLRMSDLGRRDSFPLDGGLEKPSKASSKVSCKGLTGGKGSALETANDMGIVIGVSSCGTWG